MNIILKKWEEADESEPVEDKDFDDESGEEDEDF